MPRGKTRRDKHLPYLADNNWGRHSVARREATMPGCRAIAASQPKKPYPTESVRTQKLGNHLYRRKKQLKNVMTFHFHFFATDSCSQTRPLRTLRHSAGNHLRKAVFTQLPDIATLLIWPKRFILFCRRKRGMRGGDRRPAGAEAPTPPGRSSRAMRGTAGGRCPMPCGREEEEGLAKQIYKSSRMAAPTRGWGS